MAKLNNVHDNFFKRVFSNQENIRAFLKMALPDELLKSIELADIDLDMTGYVSDDIKGHFSDIVVKTKINSGIDTDIYFLFEHKSYEDQKIFIQFLKYMYLSWQRDSNDKKPLRVILPIVFYHGKKKWRHGSSFIDQFDVNNEIKKFLLNYRFILFDTNQWDFNDPRNKVLSENIFLLTSLLLMKGAMNKDMDVVAKVFDFWHETGLFKEKDHLQFFLTYIVSTKDISPHDLAKMLEESKISGGDIMPTLAQRWLEEGKEQGMQQGVQQGLKQGKQLGKKDGLREGKIQTAKKALKEGLPIEVIARITQLPKKEIEALKKEKH